MPAISIIVPCYNVAPYLPQCIESLTSQSFRDIEIILVDDSSPDSSGKICDRYADRDSRIRVIHKENGGVSAARNDGLAIATGEYVLFCDGDDWMAADACAHICRAINETGADVIFGDIVRSREKDDRYVRFFENPFCTGDPVLIRELVRANFYPSYCPTPARKDPADGCYGGPWNKVVKRELLMRHRIRFDPRVQGICDDVIYSAYVLAHARKVAYVGMPIYHYRQTERSMTHVYRANILQINASVFQCWEEFLNLHDPCGQWRQAYYANVIRRLDHALEVYFLSDANPASISGRKQELAALLEQEPYRTAVRQAEPDKLKLRHRVEAWMASRNRVEGLWMAYRASVWTRKMRRAGRL